MTYYRCGRDEAYFLPHSSSTCAIFFMEDGKTRSKSNDWIQTQSSQQNSKVSNNKFHRKMIVILVLIILYIALVVVGLNYIDQLFIQLQRYEVFSQLQFIPGNVILNNLFNLFLEVYYGYLKTSATIRLQLLG